MKILIAAAAHSTEMSGLQRHAFNMVQCLLTCPEVSEVQLVVAPWQRRLVERAFIGADKRLSIYIGQMRRSSFGRNFWYYFQLPQIAQMLSADLVHLSYPVPVHAKAFSCPTIMTLHDLYPYEIPLNFGFPKFLFNRLVLQQCLKAVDAVVCVSHSTARSLQQYTQESVWHKSECIPNCVQPAAIGAPLTPPPGWEGEQFLLCVGQHRRNKNIALLMLCFERLLQSSKIDKQMKLFVVGINGPETSLLHKLVTKYGLESNVRFFAGLSESELQWCYAHCAVLVSPSITEGFGLPVVEGLMTGCNVVCSDISAHREIGSEHCSYVPLNGREEELLISAILEAVKKPRMTPVAFPHLSAAVLGQQYTALYLSLLNRPLLRHRRQSSVSPYAQGAGLQQVDFAPMPRNSASSKRRANVGL